MNKSRDMQIRLYLHDKSLRGCDWLPRVSSALLAVSTTASLWPPQKPTKLWLVIYSYILDFAFNIANVVIVF